VILIVVVVIIAIAVVTAMVSLLFLGIVENQGEELTTVNQSMPIVTQRDIDGTVYWDSTSTINMVTPRDADVPWSDVRVDIKAPTGSVLLPLSRPLPDDPSTYDDASGGSVDVEVWFVDVDGDGQLEAGDSLKITGMTNAYEGSIVEMMLSARRIAESRLPMDFP
jgi:hypothetical protein